MLSSDWLSCQPFWDLVSTRRWLFFHWLSYCLVQSICYNTVRFSMIKLHCGAVNVVSFLKNPHKRHPIAHLLGWDMAWLLWIKKPWSKIFSQPVQCWLWDKIFVPYLLDDDVLALAAEVEQTRSVLLGCDVVEASLGTTLHDAVTDRHTDYTQTTLYKYIERYGHHMAISGPRLNVWVANQ